MHINGNVQGLPTKFPNREATMLPLNIQAKVIPIKKCNPNNGVSAATTPKVKPRAIV